MYEFRYLAFEEDNDLEISFEEPLEEIPEEVPEEDLPSDAAYSGDDFSYFDPEEPDLVDSEEFRNILREIVAAANASSEGSSEEVSSASSASSSGEDITDIVSSFSSDQAAFNASLGSFIDSYQENNRLDAALNEVSLSNFLIFLCFVGLLFTAALNFARRII